MSTAIIRRAPQDIHWLAGLLEGEGWFGWSKSRGPSIQLEMTDRDVVERVGILWYRGVYRRPPRKEGWLETYRVEIRGKDAIGWIMTILPHMGNRRTAKIREIIEQWKAH